MADPTNAQVVAQITALLVKWNAREAELSAWQAGSASGGPNGDGRYPLTNASGETILLECPAKLADAVSGPAAIAAAAQQGAETAQRSSEAAIALIQFRVTRVLAAAASANSASALAKTYRDQAAAERAAAEAAAQTARVTQVLIDGGNAASTAPGTIPFKIDFGGST